jgi:uncharacterized protein (TIGR00299 family) protein
MLLGALAGAGVPVAVLQSAVDAVAPSTLRLDVENVTRAGLAARHCHVAGTRSAAHRTWRDVRGLLAGADLSAAVRDRAAAVFARLAAAEGAVHGIPPEQVTFHEVGALDAIADVVGVCAGLDHLALDRLVVSPVAVGAGRVQGAHGSLPVPAPAVVELLRGVPTLAGPGERESCTPTGAALLRTWADGFGAQPAMTVSGVGIGAGSRDPAGHANVLRLLVGAADAPAGAVVLLESNVDDQDPRLWPTVLADLLDAGAVDAWLVPIVMKKGRPAHTVCALAPPDRVPAVRTVLFTATSTIGVRESAPSRTVLDRETRTVTVRGHPIRVKVARHAGRVVNAQPEFDDVEAAARAVGVPVGVLLTEAVRALPDPPA